MFVWRREKKRRREEDVRSRRKTEAQTERLDFHDFFISRKFNIYILVYSHAVEEELTSGLLQQQARYRIYLGINKVFLIVILILCVVSGFRGQRWRHT